VKKVLLTKVSETPKSDSMNRFHRCERNTSEYVGYVCWICRYKIGNPWSIGSSYTPYSLFMAWNKSL